MNPISNQQFSYDFQKFVLQDPNIHTIHMQATPKPFSLTPPEKSGKSKKDVKKQKKQKDDTSDTSTPP